MNIKGFHSLSRKEDYRLKENSSVNSKRRSILPPAKNSSFLPKINVGRPSFTPMENLPYPQSNKEHAFLRESELNTLMVANNGEINPIYSYFVGFGNNADVVRRILRKRRNWVERKENPNEVNFRWQQTCSEICWEKFGGLSNKCINHFEFNGEIGKKDCLARNLRRFLEKKFPQICLFDIIPFTFEFNLQRSLIEPQLKLFILIHNKVICGKSTSDVCLKGLFPKRLLPELSQLASITKSSLRNSLNIETSSSTGKMSNEQLCFGGAKAIPSTFIGPANMWIVKPTFQNRGRGIEIVNSVQELEKVIQNFMSEGRSSISKSVLSQKILVQKYCENSLLIDKRKFDIRVWCLLDHNLNAFICREGYLRFSSFSFSLENAHDKLIHLTNNAIQRNSEQYGSFEKGNQRGFSDLRNSKFISSFDKIYLKIRLICSLVLHSVTSKLNYNRRKNCFEIFGFDFLLDKSETPWLLEVNINPCLETSSPLLEKLIPRMLDDAFKLTLDHWYSNQVDLTVVFPFPGLIDGENIWERLNTPSKYLNSELF